MIKDYFKEINSEEKAYWLGFLYADGCVDNNLRHIILELNIKDYDHIVKFKEVLETNAKIAIKEPTTTKPNRSVRIVISCKQMCCDLVKLGCIPCKSAKLVFPNKNQVPNHLLSHFIRGYFDGDGCLCCCERYRKRPDRRGKEYHYKTWFLTFVGTEDFLLGICNFLGDKTKLIKNSKCTYQLKFGGNLKIKKLMSKFYENANVYLDRKQIIYQNLIS